MRRFSVIIRVGIISAAGFVACLAVGCAKQEDQVAPELALGDQPGALMPTGRPAADLSLLLDQTSVTLVKKIEIKYGPLKHGGSDDEEGADAAPGSGKKPAKAAASVGKRSKTASTDPDKPRKRTKIGSALSSAMGMISGRRSAAPPAAPAQPSDDDDEEEESATPPKPKTPPVKLIDPRGTAAEIPAAPAGVSSKQLNEVRAAARADAIKNLMKVAYTLSLEPGSTVGDAIGQSPDEFPNEPEGIIVFDARWTDDETLEVEVEITIGQLVTALTTAYEGTSFDPLKALDASKAITAKGTAKVPGGKPADGGGKKPAPKRPKSKGGGTT